MYDRVSLCDGSASIPRRRKVTWTPQSLVIAQEIPDHRENTFPIQLACNESATFM